ncbi:MAG TPA: ABC transporter ATP-binding protein [Planctomycetaceae bacterium]|jgi:ABC-2 type transport system ATP-binding protein|nr:ABC transporter ATP-binding protein [Planctomycetaceae bacterium]
MIQATELHKSFGQLRAVQGVSLEIRRGETFGLLGANGAGKSTTINLLAGLLPPDSGQVVIDGSSDPTRREVRRQIGIAPQSLALYEELSAEENVRFLGKLYGLSGSKLKERIEYALTLSGLADRRKDPVAQFSGGMKRRLNLAAALVHEPKVLFLDEPTVGVDPQSRNRLFDNIRELASQGMTILYTTHYMEEAERLCDRVAIMEQGKILALDRVDGLIDQYGGLAVVEAELKNGHLDPAQQRSNLAAAVGKNDFLLEANKLRLESKEPLEDVARLAQAGIGLKTLHLERPDLETVFLNLTGRRLRDE